MISSFFHLLINRAAIIKFHHGVECIKKDIVAIRRIKRAFTFNRDRPVSCKPKAHSNIVMDTSQLPAQPEYPTTSGTVMSPFFDVIGVRACPNHIPIEMCGSSVLNASRRAVPTMTGLVDCRQAAPDDRWHLAGRNLRIQIVAEYRPEKTCRSLH